MWRVGLCAGGLCGLAPLPGHMRHDLLAAQGARTALPLRHATQGTTTRTPFIFDWFVPFTTTLTQQATDPFPNEQISSLCPHHVLFVSKIICLSVPPQGINPIELGNVAVAEILKRFYADFPPHPKEKDYNFNVSSSMKPTQVRHQRPPLSKGLGQAVIAV